MQSVAEVRRDISATSLPHATVPGLIHTSPSSPTLDPGLAAFPFMIPGRLIPTDMENLCPMVHISRLAVLK